MMSEKMKRERQLFMAIMLCTLIMLSTSTAQAASEALLTVPCEAAVDGQTGEFDFDIRIDCDTFYAGMEFGVICSEGCEITSVSYDAEVSATGPKEANGLTWFGFFDGEDSISGEITASVKGTCKPGQDAAVAVRDIRQYTIGGGDYESRALESGYVVNLKEDESSGQTQEAQVQDKTKEDKPHGMGVSSPETGDDIDVKWIIAGCLVIAAAIAAPLIYIVRKNSNKV